jgi:hypothetical protein
MTTAIQFDSQFFLMSVEVQNKSIYWMLTTKLIPTETAIAKKTP